MNPLLGSVYCLSAAIAFAAGDAAEALGHDSANVAYSAAGTPHEDTVVAWVLESPEQTAFDLAVARRQARDHRFVCLDLSAIEHAGVDCSSMGLSQCAAYSIRRVSAPWQLDALPQPVDLFLSIQRQVVAVFAHDDLCH